jgi:hypothetical protein
MAISPALDRIIGRGKTGRAMEFFRKHHKVVIWLMILSFLVTLIPSLFFLLK